MRPKVGSRPGSTKVRFLMPGYPIELDVRGRLALVVGLGRVGGRKALGLIEAGARVIGVDPNPSHQPSPKIEHRIERFRPEHLDHVRLAIAAAPPEVNRQVVMESRKAGVWVNSTSDPHRGDFSVPAVWRGGLMTLTVATSGAGPALARSLRDRAAKAIEGAPDLATLLAEIRPQVLSRISNPATRHRLLSAWGDAKWLDLSLSEGIDAVRAAWLKALEALEDTDHGTTLPESTDFF